MCGEEMGESGRDGVGQSPVWGCLEDLHMLSAQSWEGCGVAAGLLCRVPGAWATTLLVRVSPALSVASVVGTTALTTFWS